VAPAALACTRVGDAEFGAEDSVSRKNAGVSRGAGCARVHQGWRRGVWGGGFGFAKKRSNPLNPCSPMVTGFVFANHDRLLELSKSVICNVQITDSSVMVRPMGNRGELLIGNLLETHYTLSLSMQCVMCLQITHYTLHANKKFTSFCTKCVMCNVLRHNTLHITDSASIFDNVQLMCNVSQAHYQLEVRPGSPYQTTN
jgi:hypothetical protein